MKQKIYTIGLVLTCLFIIIATAIEYGPKILLWTVIIFTVMWFVNTKIFDYRSMLISAGITMYFSVDLLNTGIHLLGFVYGFMAILMIIDAYMRSNKLMNLCTELMIFKKQYGRFVQEEEERDRMMNGK